MQPKLILRNINELFGLIRLVLFSALEVENMLDFTLLWNNKYTFMILFLVNMIMIRYVITFVKTNKIKGQFFVTFNCKSAFNCFILSCRYLHLNVFYLFETK